MFVCDFRLPTTRLRCNIGFHHSCRHAGGSGAAPAPLPVGEAGAFCVEHAAAASAIGGGRRCFTCRWPLPTTDLRRKFCDMCHPPREGNLSQSQPTSPLQPSQGRGGRPATGQQTRVPPPPRPRLPKADYSNFHIPLADMLDSGRGNAGLTSPREFVDSVLADGDEPAPPTVRHVPRAARLAMRAGLMAICHEIGRTEAAWSADTSRSEATLDAAAHGLAWALLLNFGHWFLCACAPAGLSLADHLRQGVDLLRAGDLAALRTRTSGLVAASAATRAARAAASSFPGADGSSASDRVAKAATNLILRGVGHGVSRGVARCASEASPAPVGAADAAKLEGLHPAAPLPTDPRVTAFAARMKEAREFVQAGHVLPLPPRDDPEAQIIADGLRLVSALSAARGKAAGPDAITADLLHELLVDCRACQTAFMAVIRLIQDGRCPSFVTARLAAARLIGLPKPGSDKLRPIAIAPVLRRVAGSLLVRHYRVKIEKAVGPRQFGFSTAGREAVHLSLKATLQEHPGWTLLELDIRNAFNEALRDAMLVECHERLPELFAMARAFYLQPSALLFRCSDASLIKLLSACGSQQGDPFGGVLFDLVLRPILDELVVRFPLLVNVAFQDNMYLVAPVALLVEATAWLRARLTEVCLVLKPAGFHTWSPTAASAVQRQSLIDLGIPEANICMPGGGFVVLGAPIGHPEYVSAEACATVESALSIFDSAPLRALDTQAQWLGLF